MIIRRSRNTSKNGLEMSSRPVTKAIIRKRLSHKRILEIRKLANQKLSEFQYRGGVVDMAKFASFLGASVRYAPYENGELAGMLVSENGQKPIIAVNSSHPPNRRRFTIAHECGHLLLHDQGVFVDERLTIRRRDGNSALAISVEEIEANQFAAEILVPLEYLLRDIDAINLDIEDESDIIKLAKKYKVSRQAMSYRVYNVESE